MKRLLLLPVVIAFAAAAPARAAHDVLFPPLSNAAARVTKKPFGIAVADRFHGYHTGADFETRPDEARIAVPVAAVCSGRLLLKRWVRGYGGTAVEACTLDGQPVTVLYGHLKLASVVVSVKHLLKAGQPLAELGAGGTHETDGERKHLHLGIHQGTGIDLRGYVPRRSDLRRWINPMAYLQK